MVHEGWAVLAGDRVGEHVGEHVGDRAGQNGGDDVCCDDALDEVEVDTLLEKTGMEMAYAIRGRRSTLPHSTLILPLHLCSDIHNHCLGNHAIYGFDMSLLHTVRRSKVQVACQLHFFHQSHSHDR
ncbi:hypothetical protein M422DRAFT_275883 [Sphaerobolus stellatus SS14]|uniref:Uncharacterized protein n=1 Tax=Sphaerobolus stellatus (strain SS14) TaxID=990650 RepID=A0A0C9UDL6_SPHS4|nr:hypothetical protein M422DRAFT_275883 [Sphaerobolus stellatus SS14]